MHISETVDRDKNLDDTDMDIAWHTCNPYTVGGQGVRSGVPAQFEELNDLDPRKDLDVAQSKGPGFLPLC